ncbi:hypothetical protein C8R46DRAFT_1038008 [Mycena filopes]|nr:hypothetical protein C8R46DRAFT_1038008 [Mycena filopes]
MCPPGPRYACTQCLPSTRCAVFVGSDIDPRTQSVIPRLIPNSSTESCACGHPYFAHEGGACTDSAHPNYLFRRGPSPSTNCGGFTSVRWLSPLFLEASLPNLQPEERWTFLTSCVCLAVLMSHNLVDTPASPRPVGGTPAILGASAHPHPNLTATLPPPIQAYRGVPPVVAGSVGTRRNASAQRTLPQHQGGAAHRGSHRGYPGGPSPFSTNIEVRVVVWPMVIPGVHEPAGHGTILLKAQNDDMITVLDHLRAHGLVVPISVPRTGPTSPAEFTAQLSAALEQRGMALRESPTAASDAAPRALTHSPWALLCPMQRLDVITFKVHPTININIFGMDEFTRVAKKFISPDANEAGPRVLATSWDPSTIPTSPLKTSQRRDTSSFTRAMVRESSMGFLLLVELYSLIQRA